MRRFFGQYYWFARGEEAVKIDFDMQNYESAKKKFRIEVPKSFNFGFDVIDEHAKDETRRALVWTDATGKETKEFTFRDLSRLSNRQLMSSGRMG